MGENLPVRETQSLACVRRLAPHVLRHPCQRGPRLTVGRGLEGSGTYGQFSLRSPTGVEVRWAVQSAGKSYGSHSASGESQSADVPSPSPAVAPEPPPTLARRHVIFIIRIISFRAVEGLQVCWVHFVRVQDVVGG